MVDTPPRVSRPSSEPFEQVLIHIALSDQDRVDFQNYTKKNEKLKMPVLAAAGDACFFAEYHEHMAKEFADDVSFKIVERSGHWMPEENPEGFYAMVKEFLEVKKLL